MSGGWSPQATRVSASGTTSAPSIGWMLLQSVWLLPIIAGMGFLAWAGFLLIGLLGKRKLWLVFAGAYAIAAVLLHTLPGYGIASIGMPLLWAVSTLHGLMTNPGWLRERWARQAASAPAAQTVTAPAKRGTKTSRKSAETRTRAQLRAQATAQSGQAASSTNRPTPPAFGTVAGPINPATATADELELVPYMSRARAEYVVEHRHEVPLASLEDLIEMLHLQPHEAVSMRGRLTFEPAAAAPNEPKQPRRRRKPQEPESKGDQPTGRILDV